jgi:hypothetical protein
MKTLWKAIYAVALTLAVAITGIRGYGQTIQDIELSGSGTFADGVQAYIYGYPLLMFGVTGRTATTVQDTMTRLGAAPLNQFGKEQNLPNSTFTSVVLPSTTTLYASAFINLQTEPVILHIPSINNRFFLLQMLDAWTNVSTQSPGSRLNSEEGNYALVGPDWKKELPSTINHVIKMPTNSMWIIGRIYTNGTDSDIQEIKDTIYPGLTLTPLSGFISGNYVAPADLPLQPMVDFITTPLDQAAGMDACAFFGNMASMMRYNPSIPEQDDAILPKLAGLGLQAGSNFDCTQLNRAKLATLQLSVATAKILLNRAPTPPPTSTQWTLSLGVGTYGNNYLLRAEVAKDALGANNPIDAVYGYTQNGARGGLLNGSRNYKIHFNPPHKNEGIPPVNPSGFWSLTIYNSDGTLVRNKVLSYNAIGVPFVQQHQACFNADGSLDLYLQSTPPPSGTPYCNWLETPPDAGFIAFLRMYWPDQIILDKQWIPPAIERNN